MIDKRYKAIINDWAEELGQVTNRPAEDIYENGINALDFPQSGIEIFFEDGSYSKFNYTFYIRSLTKKAIAVFTEHCGYFVLPIANIEIKEFK